MKKILIVCLCVLINDACADSSNKRLSVYECSKWTETELCSSGCKNSPLDEIEFLVDKKKERVMQKKYLNGKFFSSRIYEECKIFDDKNWVCEERTLINEEHAATKRMGHGMHDGVHFNYLEGIYSSCAK